MEINEFEKLVKSIDSNDDRFVYVHKNNYIYGITNIDIVGLDYPIMYIYFGDKEKVKYGDMVDMIDDINDTNILNLQIDIKLKHNDIEYDIDDVYGSMFTNNGIDLVIDCNDYF